MSTIENRLKEKTDAIYKNMVESLEKDGYDFNSEKNYVCTFHPQIGSLYKNGGIAFYGRATNGWDDDYNNGINSIYTHSHSPFFQMIKRIASSIYYEAPIDHIVWSNICKVAPEAGNPSDDLWDKQYFFIKDILQIEQEVLHPAISILFTGIAENNRWDAPIFELFPKLQLLSYQHDDSIGIECGVKFFYNEKSAQYFAITGRPEFKSSEFRDHQANHIISFIKNTLHIL